MRQVLQRQAQQSWTSTQVGVGGRAAPAKSIYGGGQIFSPQDYALYKDVTERLKAVVEETFGLSSKDESGGSVSDLHFTAPTFITREVGDESWRPTTMHDEYWHPHVDKNNTEHYDYSGLVYLSTLGEDFGPGGELHFYPDSSLDCAKFVDPVEPGPCKVTGPADLVVEPRRGRLIVFGSGRGEPAPCDSRREGHQVRAEFLVHV